MTLTGTTLSQQEIEQLVHDVLADSTLRFDKVRTLAVLRAKGYESPELVLGRIEAEFQTPGNLQIQDESFGRAMDEGIAAAEIRVQAELLARRLHHQ